MTPTITDQCSYCQLESDQPMGINGYYINDLLRARAYEWKTHSDAVLQRLETTGNQIAQFIFARIFFTASDIMYHIDQDFYMSRTEQTRSNAEFSKFASMRARLVWLETIDPTKSSKSHKLLEQPEEYMIKHIGNHCKRSSRAIKYVHDHESSIRIP